MERRGERVERRGERVERRGERVQGRGRMDSPPPQPRAPPTPVQAPERPDFVTPTHRSAGPGAGGTPPSSAELKASVQSRLDQLAMDLEAASSARKSRAAQVRHDLEVEAEHLADVQHALEVGETLEFEEESDLSPVLGAFLFQMEELIYTAQLAVVTLISLGGHIPPAFKAILHSGRLTRAFDPPEALHPVWGAQPGTHPLAEQLQRAQTAWLEMQYTRTMMDSLLKFATESQLDEFAAYADVVIAQGVLSEHPPGLSSPEYAATAQGLRLLEDEEYTRTLLWYLIPHDPAHDPAHAPAHDPAQAGEEAGLDEKSSSRSHSLKSHSSKSHSLKSHSSKSHSSKSHSSKSHHNRSSKRKHKSRRSKGKRKRNRKPEREREREHNAKPSPDATATTATTDGPEELVVLSIF